VEEARRNEAVQLQFRLCETTERHRNAMARSRRSALEKWAGNLVTRPIMA
jgi:hypothetical protein